MAPYGYKKSPQNKHRLVIDPIASTVVMEIFKLFLNGIGVRQIAIRLSERQVPIPSVHNNINIGNASISYGLWTHTGIKRILQNEIYTGTLVQSKYKKLNYKSSKLLSTDQDAWIKMPNAHEAIVAQEAFDKAQRLLEATACPKPSKHKYLLSGLLKCYMTAVRISVWPRKINMAGFMVDVADIRSIINLKSVRRTPLAIPSWRSMLLAC
ncbi:MAG: recombinase family protein [Defluviitaleaceae bacterium]|nr:recombinase family protein [Defluviitaleaceae bacterium]